MICIIKCLPWKMGYYWVANWSNWIKVKMQINLIFMAHEKIYQHDERYFCCDKWSCMAIMMPHNPIWELSTSKPPLGIKHIFKSAKNALEMLPFRKRYFCEMCWSIADWYTWLDLNHNKIFACTGICGSSFMKGL